LTVVVVLFLVGCSPISGLSPDDAAEVQMRQDLDAVRRR